MILTTVVIGNAYYQKKQFYPSVVYITKSNPSMAVSILFHYSLRFSITLKSFFFVLHVLLNGCSHLSNEDLQKNLLFGTSLSQSMSFLVHFFQLEGPSNTVGLICFTFNDVRWCFLANAECYVLAIAWFSCTVYRDHSLV